MAGLATMLDAADEVPAVRWSGHQMRARSRGRRRCGHLATQAMLSAAALLTLSARPVALPRAAPLRGASAAPAAASAPAFAAPATPGKPGWRADQRRVQEPVSTATPLVQRELQVPLFYQVNFLEEKDAKRAVKELDGSVLGGSTLRVIYNDRALWKTCVNVQGVPHDITDEQLRYHFELVGKTTLVRRFEDTLYGEVRFHTPDEAWNAKVTMDGSVLYNKQLRVELDCSTDYMNKVLVHGINPGVMWQELKDHFKQAGKITFATIHGGKTARIRFFQRDAATSAMKRLNRSRLPGTTDKIQVALPFDGTEDTAEVRVRRFPDDTTVQDIRNHFSQCGEIEDVTIEVEEPLPLEFCE